MKTPFSILILILLLVTSCGDNPQEKAEKGIDEALTFLSDEKCDKAIKVLEDLKDQDSNPIYLKTYASAYACLAGVNMIKFVEDDITAIDDNNLFQSLSILSYSDESAVDSASYTSMLKALDILGKGNTYSQVQRTAKFGKRQGEDMGVEVLVYAIVALGKFTNWYGNVNAVGKKGAGTNTNSCYLNYTYGPAVAVIGTLPGTNACSGITNDGHPDLNGASKITRMCEGLTLMTNVYDVLNNIDLTSSSTMSSLEQLVAEINTYRTAANAAGVGYLLDVTSPSACRTLLANTTDMNNAELLFALVLEQEHE